MRRLLERIFSKSEFAGSADTGPPGNIFFSSPVLLEQHLPHRHVDIRP
jgi:hypothetical protein